ncbi:MAG: D-tyrosyl-tRNA(Tyr) deacylase [Clostridia bacterium]|nr:D-tyrosyl-tRNA(Tyr) deacylase [Clostridia bacterium]
MKIVLQRVKEASVTIEGNKVSEIGKGYLLLLGVSNDDTREIADKMIEKISRLRIFEDSEGKTNLSIDAVSGEVMVVSQFTLYADCRKGNRPSFINAGSPQLAEELYEYIKEKCKAIFGKVECGQFGADMKVSLINDGPFTLVLDSKELF